MKTAVSIPDDVFEEADRLAKDLKTSRSDLYSRALKGFLARHAPDAVTEAMNRAVADIGETSDPFVTRAARLALERSEW
jgi:metal-responsive CopG/Arc/MetJ family transcriptional regulator